MTVDDRLRAARIARNEGRIEDAEPLYQSAVDEARRANDPIGLAHGLRHLSDVARTRGHTDIALSAGLEAVSTARAIAGLPALDLANALRVAALALQMHHRWTEARPVWTEARGYYAAAGVAAGVDECDAALASFPTPLP
jgi:DNA-binding phage protein